jgi:citrate/tricarballylate utilization protein
MGPLLALHLGVVFALFVTMPYGKFVHGIYRYVALVRYAQEQRVIIGEHEPPVTIATTGQGGTRP